MFGRYELQAVLGRGGYGEVYRAELNGPAGFRKAVAVKILRSGTRATAEDLFKEARLSALLHHPNVVGTYELGIEEDLPFICMEWVRGGSLADLLGREKRLSGRATVELGIQLCGALSHAHGLTVHGQHAALVHRDLKPANVLFDASGIAKLGDFGIAVAPGLPGEDHGEVIGTLRYMSPEQACGNPLEPSSDLYSLALMLYATVMGHPLLRRPNIASVVVDRATTQLDRRDIATTLEARAPGLGAVLRQCLRERPRDRIQDADTLADALGLLLTSGYTGPALAEMVRVDEGPSSPLWEPSQTTLSESDATYMTNIRPAADAFVGRIRESEVLWEHLEAGARLLTLKGTGGTGKTRLARALGLERAGVFPGGVWFCDLSDSHSLLGILRELANVLGTKIEGGDEGQQIGAIGATLRGRGPSLIVLDNFEQVADLAARFIPTWLGEAPELRLLVTSRERLGLPGEVVHELAPLQAKEGIELFLSRARAQVPDWRPSKADRDAVARIVQTLDGLPLALELAAARVAVIPPTELERRLTSRFRVLGRGDSTERHDSLEQTIDWSWALLNPWEQEALAQLSVFAGFTLDQAEQVIRLGDDPRAPWLIDVVGALLDKSLLRTVEFGERPRFDMLLSIREYSAQRLAERPSLAGTKLRHARAYGAFGDDDRVSKLDLQSGRSNRQSLFAETANLNRAVEHALSIGEHAAALGACRAVVEVALARGPYQPAADLCARVVADHPVHSHMRTVLRRRYAHLLWNLGRGADAQVELEGVLAECANGIDPHTEALVLGNLGVLATGQGRMAEGRDFHERAIVQHRALGNRRAEGIERGNLAILDQNQGRLDAALDQYEEALSIQRDLRNTRSVAILLFNQGGVFSLLDRNDDALAAYAEALPLHREHGDRMFEGLTLGNLGLALLETGASDEGRASLEAAISICQEIEHAEGEGAFTGSLAELEASTGGLRRAAELFDRAEVLLRERGVPVELGNLLCRRGRYWISMGERASAEAALEEARGIAAQLGVGPEAQLGRELARLEQKWHRK